MGRKKRNSDVFIFQRMSHFDYNLVLCVIFLLCFGLIMLYSMSYHTAILEGKSGFHYVIRQGIFAGIGFMGMLVVSTVSRKKYEGWSKYIYWFSILTLLYVELNGAEFNGARRWISIANGAITVQPSEFTKVAVILFVSSIIFRSSFTNEKKPMTYKIAAITGISFITVALWTDNFSTAIIVASICVGIYLVAMPYGQTIMLLAMGGLMVCYIAILRWSDTIIEKLTSQDGGFRLERIVVWLDPSTEIKDKAYQTTQGLYAIGSGGFLGKGLGNGTQKLDVIPEVQNDMILAAIAEELGIIGVIIVLILFGMLLYRLYQIAKNSPDMYGGLVVSGIFIHISLQVVLNICVVTNVIPNTGVTLPFVSYGGTSIAVLLAEIGLALGVSNTIREENG